jgi:hypothetical protein
LAKPDRPGCNLYSPKYDSIKRSTRPQSNTDRWCFIIEHRRHFSVCCCAIAYSSTLSCQSIPNGWTDCRSYPTNDISWLRPDSYTGRRCYAISDADSDSVDHGRQFSAESRIDNRCYLTVDDHIDSNWRVFDHIYYFSANSSDERRFYVISHSCVPNSRADGRCHAVDRIWHSSADSHNIADSRTMELCSRSPGDSCFERHCFNLGFGG